MLCTVLNSPSLVGCRLSIIYINANFNYRAIFNNHGYYYPCEPIGYIYINLRTRKNTKQERLLKAMA